MYKYRKKRKFRENVIEMFTRDEYKNLIDAFTKDVKERLTSEVKSLLLVGSVAAGEHIAGESDCDFVLILKDNACSPNAIHDTLTKIRDVINTYLEDPLFSSLIDVEVISENDVPTGDNDTKYPWTKVLVAKNGKVLIGDNPFNNIEVKEEKIKESARKMALEYYNQMKDLVLFPQADDYQQTFMAVELVLGAACAYLYYNGERNFYRSNAIILFEEKYKDKIDITPVQISHRLRLAAKSEDIKDFIPKSMAFCRTVVNAVFQ